ncbi:MAG TPA: hypothetical protein VFG15_03225 [Amycolatopsis sp.]|nr:hypothetical protein [Amycolatopsis sp.]
MTEHPKALTLPADETDDTVRDMVTARFGPGTTILGITGLGHHPSIHRADHTTPRTTDCGMTNRHGEPLPITQVFAVTTSPSAEPVAALLGTAGYDACRMCRRCWHNDTLPQHDVKRCFSTRARPRSRAR